MADMRRENLKYFACIILLMFIVLPASAETWTPGVRIGMARPSIAQENTLAVGLDLRMHNGSSLMLQPYLDYWTSRHKSNNDESWEWQLFSLGLSALKPFNLNNSRAVPYVGGGFGLNYNASHMDDSTSSTSINEVDLSLNAVAGLELPLSSRLSSSVELKYVLAGVTDYFGFWIGLKYNLTR